MWQALLLRRRDGAPSGRRPRRGVYARL